MIVIPGPSSLNLGAKVAEIAGCRRVDLDYKTFPDGESYIRLREAVAGEAVALVQTTFPQQDKRLIELLLLTDALKDMGAKRVTVIAPYMAYARQDMRFRDGETVSIKTIFKLIEGAGADQFITVDIHKESTLSAFSINAKNLYASEVIGKYIRDLNLKSPYILSPDKGAIMIAKRVADIVGAECGNFEKARDRITGAITVKGERVDASGRDIAIVDDMISTGGTIASAAKMMKDRGASRVMAFCTHPLLVAGARERMKISGVDEVLGTDTVESEISAISVAPLIAKGLS